VVGRLVVGLVVVWGTFYTYPLFPQFKPGAINQLTQHPIRALNDALSRT